ILLKFSGNHTPSFSERVSYAALNICRIVGIDYLCEPPFKEDLFTCVGSASYYRNSAGKRLNIDDAESFAFTGKHENIGKKVVISFLRLRDVAGKDDPIGEFTFADFRLKPRSVTPLTDNEVCDIGFRLGETGDE